MPESLHPAVVSALQSLALLPASPAGGRFLTLAAPGVNQAEGSADNPDHILSVLIQDLLSAMSPELIAQVPPVDLEQFSLQCVYSDESGSDLLARLITAFIKAYANPDSQIPALALMLEMESLSSD